MYNQSCFLSVENNYTYETNVLQKDKITKCWRLFYRDHYHKTCIFRCNDPLRIITDLKLSHRSPYRRATHDFSSADDAERAKVSPGPLLLGHHQVSQEHLTIQCCNCHWKRKWISKLIFTNKGISTKSNIR